MTILENWTDMEGGEERLIQGEPLPSDYTQSAIYGTRVVMKRSTGEVSEMGLIDFFGPAWVHLVGPQVPVRGKSPWPHVEAYERLTGYRAK